MHSDMLTISIGFNIRSIIILADQLGLPFGTLPRKACARIRYQVARVALARRIHRTGPKGLAGVA